MPSAWISEWNTILRKVIWKDDKLKELMMIPDGTDIITFFDKYFIRAGYANTLVEHEDVRITYGVMGNSDTDVPDVKRNLLNFDIYVKTEHLHDADRDRLLYRTVLIADRLKEMLKQKDFIEGTGYKFRLAGEGELGTRTIGYSRYGISFSFMRVY